MSLSSVGSCFCQESLAYADRSLEAAPGEKVLRDNKEQRDQQNRLKDRSAAEIPREEALSPLVKKRWGLSFHGS